MIFDYASQLLSALEYLHSKKYIHAPGELNSSRIYFTQSYNEVLMDIGKSSTCISNGWLFQNLELLLKNRKYYEKSQFLIDGLSFLYSNSLCVTRV